MTTIILVKFEREVEMYSRSCEIFSTLYILEKSSEYLDGIRDISKP